MIPWVMVAVGGALGALSRYAIDRAIVASVGRPTVLGILLINITGSFLLGLFVSISAERFGVPDESPSHKLRVSPLSQTGQRVMSECR